MNSIYHILNGDALKELFPTVLRGKIIVTRECMVHGNVQGLNLKELFKNRARFIHKAFHIPEQDYYNINAIEFDRMKAIEATATVYLWFEEDLFCQVNLWFVIHLLLKNITVHQIYLVRPPVDSCYNFGASSTTALTACYDRATRLSQSELWNQLWPGYQKNDVSKLLEIAQQLKNNYPFLLPVVQAHIDRLPIKNQLTRPQKVIKQIIKDLNTTDLSAILKEFTTREGIYGYGDWQVKLLLKEINEL